MVQFIIEELVGFHLYTDEAERRLVKAIRKLIWHTEISKREKTKIPII